MCGIVGYVGDKQVVGVILDGLKKLEYRGYDSAGIAVVDEDGSLTIRRAEGKLRNLEETIRLKPLDGTYGIGHTRWATHGRPTEENAHPHRDCKGDVVVVHNGIVENYLTLKHQLEAEGHVFRTETDTEIIAHLVEKHFKGNLEEAVRASVKQLTGVFALAVVFVFRPCRGGERDERHDRRGQVDQRLERVGQEADRAGDDVGPTLERDGPQGGENRDHRVPAERRAVRHRQDSTGSMRRTSATVSGALPSARLFTSR